MLKMAPSSAKRGAMDSSGYVEGAILRITLEHFLTYDSCEIRPGPHLNMIIGPNTSGKSSIVCAICLGLAGKTGFLGRAQQASEFIKHGCAKAVIEITLYKPDGEHYVIRREISRPNKSEWSIGGRPSTQKAVEELVLSLNVQMGNLCQFLPQDKVADFAKMTQQELLENTEKAAGPPGMHENHQKLKAAREKSRSLENGLKSTNEVLDREKQKNARLETDVKNFQARQKHLEQIKILKMKRAWVEYEEKRKDYNNQKKEKDELTERLKKARSQHAPLRNKINDAQERNKAVTADLRKMSELVRKHAQNAADKSKAIDKESDLTQEALDELKARRLQEAKRRKSMVDLRQHLRTMEEELAGIVDSEDVQGEIEKCAQNIRQTNQEMNSAHHKGEVLRTEIHAIKRDITSLQSQLRRVQDLSNQRLSLLRHKHKDTYEAVLWLRHNQQRFKKKIYEPLMLIINVNEERFAKYVEGHISFNDMKAFVCEDPEDMEAFLKAVRDGQGLQVNAVMAPKEAASDFTSSMDITNLERFGFKFFLKDLFDCPGGAMAYLCKLYNVHNVPVGNDYTKQNVPQVTSQFSTLQRFYTAHHSYTIKRSRYAGTISTRCTEIKKAQLLTVILDDQRERQLKKDLSDRTALLEEKEMKYRELQAAHKALETRMEALRVEKRTLYQKKDLRQSLTQRINMKQQNIARLEKDTIDLDKEDSLCKKKIERINSKKMRLMKELRDHTSICQKSSFDKVRASMKQAALTYLTKSLENDIREQSHNLQILEAEFERSKERLREVKDIARQLLTAAHKATGTQQNEELSPEMTRAFSVLPNTVEEIDANIHQETARADCTYNTDPQVVEDYNRRKREIDRQENELTSRKRALERHQAEVEEIKAQWIEPTRELVKRIDKNFSHFFSSMRCAGEVDLNVPENPEDYEKYGIRIKVKYRDTEQLRELTPHHQSGGERSVATVLYMMALQELTKCPFRCVDEINQGMDPQNERKVFELVVKTACRKDTSQYFLLTPKLLPDLEYGERMTILCVYNGPQMLNHQEWSVKKFIRRRARLGPNSPQ